MNQAWTIEEVEYILRQLDDMNMPFADYSFIMNNNTMNLIGKGGSALVYAARSRKTSQDKYAIKVVGFDNHINDKERFESISRFQKIIRYTEKCIAKIYEYIEIWIALDSLDKVIYAGLEEPKEGIKRRLQFIVMENITPVIKKEDGGWLTLYPKNLMEADEKEVLKLAYDVANALRVAHDNNIMHRDVKLENLFYLADKKRYQLGDFGVAKLMEDEYATTTVATRGYVAPEVIYDDCRYSYTADIYSYGIMLYVLMNHLKFPGSDRYRCNDALQYRPGVIVPRPDGNISEAFYRIIAKACMYEPDERYKSMSEILEDLDKLIYDEVDSSKRKHRKEPLVISVIAGITAVIVGTMTFGEGASENYQQYQWIAVVSILIALCSFNEYKLFSIYDRNIQNAVIYAKGKSRLDIALFMTIFLLGVATKYVIDNEFGFNDKTSEMILDIVYKIDFIKVGIAGFIYCLVVSIWEKLIVMEDSTNS